MVGPSGVKTWRNVEGVSCQRWEVAAGEQAVYNEVKEVVQISVMTRSRV